MKNVFKIAVLYFWTRLHNSFHNLIFNQWGQLSAGLIKDFLRRSIITPQSIISHLIVDCSQNFFWFVRVFSEGPVMSHNLILVFNCGSLIRVFLLFQRKFSVGPVFMDLFGPVFMDRFYRAFFILLSSPS